MENFQLFTLDVAPKSVIKVLGVGGGGTNAINHMYKCGIKGVDFIACNTDAQALDNSPVPTKVQLGRSTTEGQGAGAIPEIGEKSAVESLEDIKAVLKENTKMIFITAGMGGGTGTGAAPVIAKMAKEMDILTIGIVTAPFQFEGKTRVAHAQAGIEKLRKHVDSLIIVNNNKLIEVYGDLGYKDAFAKADEVLLNAAKGIAEVITYHYKQNIDFRDAKTVLANSGTAIMGSATASGEDRARTAIVKALESPLLNDNQIKGTKNVLLLIVSGAKEITLTEIGEISAYIQEESGNNADIIMGLGDDHTLGDGISITIIATGFGSEQQYNIANLEPRKVIHALESNQSITQSFVIGHNKDINSDNLRYSSVVPKNENKSATKVEALPVKRYDLEDTPVNAKDFIITETKPQERMANSTPPEKVPAHSDFPIFQFDAANYKSNAEYTHGKVVVNLEENPKEKPIPDDSGFIEYKKIIPQTSAKMLFGNSTPQKQYHNTGTESLQHKIAQQKQESLAFAKDINAARLREMESIPAYIRAGAELKAPVSHQENPMKSTVSIVTDVNNRMQLRATNSFLHDNVD